MPAPARSARSWRARAPSSLSTASTHPATSQVGHASGAKAWGSSFGVLLWREARLPALAAGRRARPYCGPLARAPRPPPPPPGPGRRRPQADNSTVRAARLTPPADNYLFVNGDGAWEGIVAVRVESTAGFVLTEFAVNTGICTQWAAVDMGEVKQVGMVR